MATRVLAASIVIELAVSVTATADVIGAKSGGFGAEINVFVMANDCIVEKTKNKRKKSFYSTSLSF